MARRDNAEEGGAAGSVAAAPDRAYRRATGGAGGDRIQAPMIQPGAPPVGWPKIAGCPEPRRSVMLDQVRRARVAVTVLLFAVVVLGWLPTQAQDAVLRLRLLSTTDIHTHIV